MRSRKNYLTHLYNTSFYFLFFILTINSLTAQPIFSPGNVVLTNGDSLKGFVQELPFNKRFEKCVFKLTGKSQSITYLPSEIRSYSITDKNYLTSRKINVEGEEKQDVFVAYYVEGTMNLIRYQQRYFLETSEGYFQEVLVKEKENATPEEKVEAGEKKLRWFQLLSDMNSRCKHIDTLFNDSKKSKYKVENFIQFSIEYNKCQGSEYKVYEKNIPKPHISYSPYISFNSTFVEFPEVSFEPIFFLRGEILTNSGVELGLTFIVHSISYLPPNLSLYLEPHIRSYRFSIQKTVEEGPRERFVNNDLNVNWFELGLTSGLRYTFRNIYPKVSLQAGFRFDLFLNQEATLDREIRRFNETQITQDEISPFRAATNQGGLSTQLNLSHQFKNSTKEWEISIGYNLGRGITRDDQDSINPFVPIVTNLHTFFFKAAIVL